MPEPFSHPYYNMIRIPGGTFLMGSTEDDPKADNDEKPLYEVTLSDFNMGQYPVTQHLWRQVMGYNPSHFEGLCRPVDSVSWYDAVVFCNRLSRETGLQYVYFRDKSCRFPLGLEGEVPKNGVVFIEKNNPGFRLPTEAEWEYAARGGQYFDDDFNFAGSDHLPRVGWFKDNSGSESHEVGLLEPNALGLYDMSGNSTEWCWDWFGAYLLKPTLNSIGPDSGGGRLLRGGSWFWGDRFCRVASRRLSDPALGYLVGFRLARSLAV